MLHHDVTHLKSNGDDTLVTVGLRLLSPGEHGPLAKALNKYNLAMLTTPSKSYTNERGMRRYRGEVENLLAAAGRGGGGERRTRRRRGGSGCCSGSSSGADEGE